MNRQITKLSSTVLLSIFSAGVCSAATLEEVIVTAQKRAQPLNDVPVSVAAVSAEKITSSGIVDLQGLSDFVPNFSINETGISTTITVRGISSGINPGFEQSVGMYNDGIFYGRDQLARVPLFDMERVEVLRGPQGILFGKNSIAGAVSQITAKPTDEFEGSITALHEAEHGEQDLRLVLSGPLAENLSGRLAILDRSMDGYVHNTVTKKDEQQEDEQVVRVSLRWDIDDSTTANLKASRSTFDTVGRNLEVYNSIKDTSVGAKDHLTVLNVLQGTPIEGTLNYSGSNNGHHGNNEVSNTTLTVDRDIDGLTLTSVTGVVDYTFDELCDCDFTGAPIFNATRKEDYSQFSQEFRFTSELGNSVDYIGGLFYQSTDLKYQDTISLTNPTVITTALSSRADELMQAELVQQSAGLKYIADKIAPGASTQRDFDQDGDLWAVFAQATWNIADDLRLTAGGRYSKESKKANRIQQHRDNQGTLLGTKRTGNPMNPIDLHNSLFGIFGIEPYDEITGKLDDDTFTPMISAQWDANPDTMLYATWTKGHKSGGFDVRSNAHPDKDVDNATKTDSVNPLKSNPITGSWLFDREESNSFELGSKQTLADGAAELNLALYHTSYKDLQVSQFDGTLGFNVTNAGEATVQGIEADGRWAVSDQLTLTGSAAFLDFNYDKFPNSQCYFGQTTRNATDSQYAGLCDAKGKRREYTPEFQANLGAIWSTQVAGDFNLDASLDLAYMDEYIYAANLDPKAMQEAFTMVNARVSLADAGETWELALIGRNLTDETVINFGGNTPLASTLTSGTGNSYYGFVNRPRNIALQATYKF